MKMTTKIFNLFVTLALVLSVTACSSSDDEPETNISLAESDFEEVSSNSTFVNDIKMSDVDLLIDFAINCDLLDLEYIRFCSNDFKGDLMSGPGEYSDESFYLEVERDIMTNAQTYIDAMNRLANAGTLEDPTTRGLKDAAQATGGWVLNFVTGARDTQNKMRDILRDMGAFSNKQMQEDIFNSIKPESRGGYKDAHSFFVALNSSETSYEMLLSANGQYSSIEEQLAATAENGSHTYESWVNSREKLKIKDRINRMVDAGKDLTQKAIKVEEVAVDVMTGGGYSTAQKMDKKAKDIQETLKKLFSGKTGKMSIEDVEKALDQRGIDKLKSWLPKTGSDNADAVIKFVADKLGEIALQKDPTGEVAKKEGKIILEIKNNTDEKQKAILVVGDDGKISVVIPDEDGNGTSVTDPGDKKITAVTEDGKRSTKETTAKKDSGKQTEEIVPPSNEKPEIKVTSSTSLAFKATPNEEKGENVKTISFTTNCKYVAAQKGDAKWITLTKNVKAGTVTVTVTPNTAKEKREAKLTLVGSNDKKTRAATAEVTVTQEPLTDGKLTATTPIEIAAEGGNDFSVVTVEGYEKLTATVADDAKAWLSATMTTSDAGNDVVSLTVKPNPNVTERTGIITVTAYNGTKPTKDNSQSVEITVKQAGKEAEKMYFTPDSYLVEFGSDKGSKNLRVKTNADNVEVSSNRSWLKVSYSGGNLAMSVDENEETDDREATISVTYSRMVKTSETSGYKETSTEEIEVKQNGIEGYEIINGTWSYSNTTLVFKGKKYTYKSGSYSESGDFTIDNFKVSKIAGSDGFSVTGTLRGIKKDSWTIKTFYSKDGSGHYQNRQYCLWLTNSSGQTISVYKE